MKFFIFQYILLSQATSSEHNDIEDIKIKNDNHLNIFYIYILNLILKRYHHDLSYNEKIDNPFHISLKFFSIVNG
jgi:hypothetical protein